MTASRAFRSIDAFLVIVFIILSAATIYQIWTGTQTKADVGLVKREIFELCDSGAIDCGGTEGLPGPRGSNGTGVKDISCDRTSGQFKFIMTSGRVILTGDCLADAVTPVTPRALHPRSVHPRTIHRHPAHHVVHHPRHRASHHSHHSHHSHGTTHHRHEHVKTHGHQRLAAYAAKYHRGHHKGHHRGHHKGHHHHHRHH